MSLQIEHECKMLANIILVSRLSANLAMNLTKKQISKMVPTRTQTSHTYVDPEKDLSNWYKVAQEVLFSSVLVNRLISCPM